MEKIEVYYNDLGEHGASFFFHKFIVYTDSTGTKYAARGGPSLDGTQLITEYGLYNSGFIDYNENAQVEFIREASDLSGAWNAIKASMDATNAAHYEYINYAQNSNTAADQALGDAGLPLPQDDDPWDNWAPGSGSGFGDGAPHAPGFGDPLPGQPGSPHDPGENAGPPLPGDGGGPANQGSPLVLDLDGDGIELAALGDYNTYFDLLNNDQAVLTGWVAPDDGLLALDVNSNGMIDDSSELFGTATTDGFTVLKTYDSNGDGVINSSDTVFNNLKVWQDANRDGISQVSELSSLSALDITSIKLSSERLDEETISGNAITHQSSFTMDGVEHDVVDAWFSYDLTMRHNTGTYTLDERAIFLPELRGYGDLKDLTIAISLDNGVSSTTLMGQVIDFVIGKDLATSIANWAAVRSEVDTILLNWANVDGVNPTSRGAYVDARHLAFYEAFTGQPFKQYWSSNPLIEAANFVEAIYQNVVTHTSAQLIAQIAGSEIFEYGYYNNLTGGLGGDLSLKQSGIDAIEAAAIGALDPEAVWVQFAQFLGYTKGLGNLTVGEIAALDTAVANTAVSGLSDWADVVTSMTVNLGAIIDDPSDWGSFEVYYDNLTVGTSGNDTMTDSSPGGLTNNEFLGLGGNDTIDGGTGHDKLVGGDGNDTLIGGAGDDYLLGGEGDDIYVYDSGNDTISEVDGNGYDELHFAASTGLLQVNITDMYRHGDDMILLLSTGSYITIDKYETSAIEKLVFDVNSSALDLTALLTWKYYGTDKADTLTVSGTSVQTMTVNGYAGNDTLKVSGAAGKLYGGDNYDTLIGDYLSDQLYGENGDDYLLGKGGADFLYGGDGHDVLDGGAGNDVLEGFTGNDSYVFDRGYGNDTILDYSPLVAGPRGDAVFFKAGVLVTDVVVLRGPDPDDIVLKIIDTGETLTLLKQENYTLNNAQIGKVIFADGTIWLPADLRAMVIAGEITSGNDTTLGYRYAESFAASTGDDFIQGRGGNDTYYYAATSGNDTLHDEADSTNDTLILSGLASTDFDIFKQNDDMLLVGKTFSGSVRIEDYKITYSGQIENLVFTDTTVSGATNILAALTNGDGLVVNKAKATGGTLYGENAYNDLMIGSSANDTLYGYNGNDTFVMTAGNDTVREAAGTDTLRIGGHGIEDVSFTVSSNDLKVVVSGLGTTTLYRHVSTPSQSIENIKLDDNGLDINIGAWASWIKTSGNLTGNSSSNVLWGDSSGSTLSGQDGNDQLFGNGGNDTLMGGNGIDQLSGGAGNDALYGDAGNDVIFGDTGNDTLYGGDGYDVMHGGSGSDTFVFEATSAYNDIDLINDFSTSDGDSLDLSSLLTAYDPMTDAITDFITMTSSGGGTNIRVDRDGTGSTYAATTVARLDSINLTGSTVSDLVTNGTIID